MLFWIKDEKLKKQVSYSFSPKKNIFLGDWKLAKKRHVWNKSCWKKYTMLKMIKKRVSFIMKNVCLNKGGSR